MRPTNGEGPLSVLSLSSTTVLTSRSSRLSPYMSLLIRCTRYDDLQRAIRVSQDALQAMIAKESAMDEDPEEDERRVESLRDEIDGLEDKLRRLSRNSRGQGGGSKKRAKH